jgi:RNA polymerase sigma-70 factor (ECF subfamily)
MDTTMNGQPQSPPLDEIGLVRRALTDADAFAELYRRHVKQVYRYHIAHTGSVTEAEDLTSQTFMAALEGLRSYRGSSSFASWLMGIASHKRALFFRGRRMELPLESAAQVASRELPTDQAALQRLQVASISEALRHISPDRAEAIVLCTFAGLTFREAAGLLRKSEAAVKMLVSRGLQDLRGRTSLSLEVE